MSYDEQAMRQVVEERTVWAARIARRELVSPNDKAVAILAAAMLEQIPKYWPEEPNEAP